MTARVSLLRNPPVRRAVVAACVGTLGAGMGPIGLALVCRAAGLDYAETGLVIAGESAGLVLGGPWRGRAVDRRGQRAALLGFTTVHVLTLGAPLAAIDAGLPALALAACAAVATGTFPPYTAVLRDRWELLLPDPDDRHRGFTAQAVTQETVFVVGPVLATAIAAATDPRAILPVMALLACVGTAQMLVDAPRGRHAPRGTPTLAGALAAPGVRLVVLVHVPIGVALGSVELAAVAISEHSGDRALAGFLVATFSVGSALSGVAWARRHGVDARRAFPRLGLAFAAGLLPLLVVRTFGVALPLMAIAGLAFAPLVATVYALLDTVALPGTSAEATTWLTTAMGLGGMLGTAATGVLVDLTGPSAGYVVAAGGGVAAALLAVTGGRWLTPVGPHAP